MNEHDVLTALRGSLDEVTMSTPVERIEAEGRRRRNRRRLTLSAGAATAAALAIAVPLLGNPSTAPPSAGDSTGAGAVHVRTAAYTVDTKRDGSIVATWDKDAYFKDHAGLAKALHDAGFPVLMKVGTFCKGPDDNGKLSPSGQGPGVSRVVKGSKSDDGRVTFTFYPSAMPAGKRLFIGYLNTEQLASVHMNPGSVERIVPARGPLTCTTTSPPEHHYR
ncbi:hypothetical protein [Streptomyces sp. NPDC046939]|uniref:hypothetical protein n=1 Tax=Streptomyces sp. NPDC046939 TaxID=3155376 RepID=UPI0033C5F641